MNATKAILLTALTLALAIALTIHATHPQPNPQVGPTTPTPAVRLRASRLLAQDPAAIRNPKAADHCHKDGEVCAATYTHCCNNKCVDLHYDSRNCGACKKKCDYTEVCCQGQCVNLSFDKRHCGSCGNKCMKGGYCIYGMCDYA